MSLHKLPIITITIIIIITTTSDTGKSINYYIYLTLYKASCLNLEIIWLKRVSFLKYDKVTVQGGPLQWEVIPFALMK